MYKDIKKSLFSVNKLIIYKMIQKQH